MFYLPFYSIDLPDLFGQIKATSFIKHIINYILLQNPTPSDQMLQGEDLLH